MINLSMIRGFMCSQKSECFVVQDFDDTIDLWQQFNLSKEAEAVSCL